MSGNQENLNAKENFSPSLDKVNGAISNINFKIDIPKFTGKPPQNFLIWKRKFHFIANAYTWSENEKYYNLLGLLDGQAQYLVFSKGCNSTKNVFEILDAQYIGKDAYSNNYRKLQTLKLKNFKCIEDFEYEFKNTLDTLDAITYQDNQEMGKNEALTIYLNALSPEIYHDVIMKDPWNIREASEASKLSYSSHKDMKQARNSFNNSNERNNAVVEKKHFQRQKANNKRTFLVIIARRQDISRRVVSRKRTIKD